MRANFVRGKGDLMGTSGNLNDNAAVPAPVYSYWPNHYGLYCMAGNVNEWVMDIYRPLSFEDVDEFSPFRGNEFTKLTRDQDGYIVDKDSLGRLVREVITEEDAANRYNYQYADYKNYQDGDLNSSVGFVNQDDQAPGSDRMYAQGNTNEIDITSLINDQSRVYKGGSWKDRAYWLNPGTRRFLDELGSRDDLGFRCAMTRVGSPTGF